MPVWTPLRAAAKAAIPTALWARARRTWLQAVQRQEVARISRAGAAGAGSPQLAYIVNRGLANRLRAHLLAQAGALRSGRVLTVNWRPTDECAACFEDLFEWAGPTHIDAARAPTVIAYDRLTDRASHEAAELQALPPTRTAVFDLTWQFIGSAEFEARLGEQREAARGWLRPRADIGAEVALAHGAWGRPMLGVHIRRGDFVTHAGQGLELARYIAAIDAALAGMPADTGLYIASDGRPDEIAPLFERYPQRVQAPGAPGREPRPGAAGRASADGVRFALVQMLLLSRCQALVLTPKSSYGEMAAFLGAVPFRHA